MKKKPIKITDLETIKRLPFLFHFMTVKEHSNKQKKETRFIPIKFYQTSKFSARSHYNPISKIISPTKLYGK